MGPGTLYTGIQLQNKTIMTSIGDCPAVSVACKQVTGYGKCTVGYDPYIPEGGFEQTRRKNRSDLNAAINGLWYITMHLPLTKTRGMIGLLPRKENRQDERRRARINVSWRCRTEHQCPGRCHGIRAAILWQARLSMYYSGKRPASDGCLTLQGGG